MFERFFYVKATTTRSEIRVTENKILDILVICRADLVWVVRHTQDSQ